ncbi:flagellar basal-body rod protein FlgC [Marinicauda pacifica]|jgi:flagellar basal-body rod protein FlgC|uniref:Flagellar basal-body rod protein FlgC n=2 Tax=Alphaproteobacteria TaxID=28211 RepID=A0A4S2HAV4_9PROT|nr:MULTISPECIES: flagellar basal body rod protein FlgC [Marinicauda]TGY92751.1 flagellar basal body rod protein FlgC [Marinicauda pacifica]GGE40086.1 flagellar basal-body rod protein FlgC [Marinicauda pacifica]
MDKSSETMQIAAAGLRAQSARMRVIAENLANAQSTGRTPEEDPYRRQVPVFEAEVDRLTGLEVVRMTDAADDNSEFRLVHEPGHPAANAEGYVRYPNVSSLVELMDMKEAQRSYEANMNMVENTRRMMERTLELLRR